MSPGCRRDEERLARLPHTDDDEGSFYCPECAEREFGDD
jgi:hypothetical protein